MAIFFLFLVSLTRAEAATPLESFSLGVHRSRTAEVPKLARASVGNAKILKVRAVPPSTLLFTGLSPGKTSVRVWSGEKEEAGFEVTVLPADLVPSTELGEDRDVVKVSLEFLEIDSAISEASGLRWPEAMPFTGSGVVSGSAGFSGINYTVSFGSARGWIQHLVKEGWGKVLAHPDLYVRLGEEARFHSGGEFPVPSSSENYGRSQKHVEWKPFGMTVRVKPSSGDKLHIHSDIKVEISETNHSVSTEGVPALTNRQLETKMNSRDGETVILSGLIRKSEGREKDSVPFLANIPLIGALFFSATKQTKQESEILMAITFSLSTPQRERGAMEDFRRRFDESGNP